MASELGERTETQRMGKIRKNGTRSGVVSGSESKQTSDMCSSFWDLRRRRKAVLCVAKKERG